MAKNRPKVLDWLDAFPTTAATCFVALLIIVATAVRYLFMQPALPDLGAWLTFLGSLVTIVGGTVVGKRWTSDPAVIAAEAAAAQTPPPALAVQDGGVMVVPQPGAEQGPTSPAQ